jgi:hypothetical protein
MPAHVNAIDWSSAPEGWDWAAQDQDGRWFWYKVEPVPGLGGGVWRAPRQAQRLARAAPSNPDWIDTLQHRPMAPALPDHGPGQF